MPTDMSSSGILEIAGFVLTVRDLILIGSTLVSGAIIGIGTFRLVLRRERKLFRNLKRPLLVLGSPSNSMANEVGLMRDSGVFTIPEDPAQDLKALDRITSHSVIVVGYTAGEIDLSSVIDGARRCRVPIIVYARPGGVPEPSADMDAIRNYSFVEIANTPLRLMNLLYSILSVFPYDKE